MKAKTVGDFGAVLCDKLVRLLAEEVQRGLRINEQSQYFSPNKNITLMILTGSIPTDIQIELLCLVFA